MRVLLLCSIATLTICPVAKADTSHWTATSTASIAVTGNISIHPDRVVFGNGAEIRIKPAAADRPDVYRVDPPANPVVANGNRLCGEKAPTFIVLGRSDGADSLARSSSLFLKVFDGPEMPAAWTAEGMIGGGPGLCAILNFERATGSASRAGAATQGRDAVRQAQASLNALGFDAGPADGANGPRTRSALRAFQREAGLPVTGAPDVQTLERLTLASESRPGITQSVPADQPQPSFDCGQARSQVEKAICAVPKLGALDAELARAYQARIALKYGPEADEELQRQREWLALRDRCGADIACLEQAYEGRIAVLSPSEVVGASNPAAAATPAAGLSPEEVVRGIYATLGLAPAEERQLMAVMVAPGQRARYFTPALVAFFDANDSHGDDLSLACIDFGLVSDGNDYDEAEIARTLSIRSLVEGNRAVVDATFSVFGRPNHFRYEFTRDGAGWKIADIASLQSGWRLSAIPCEPAGQVAGGSGQSVNQEAPGDQAASAFAGSYLATSSTASGVTGNIVVTATSITFENGASIGLRAVGSGSSGVFAIDPPADPILLQAQTLCGSNPPLHIVLVADDPHLYLKVFEGADVPAPSTSMLPQPGMCALYNFQRAEQQLDLGSPGVAAAIPPASETGRSEKPSEQSQQQTQQPVPASDPPPLDWPAIASDDANAVSENWARRSAEALGKGRKHEAILAALKGLPADVTGEQLAEEFHLAHLALYMAMRADIARLRLGEGDAAASRAPFTLSPARDRVVVSARMHSGASRLELWDAETQRMIAAVTEEESILLGAYHFDPASFTRTGDRLALGDGKGGVSVIDGRDGRLLRRLGPIAHPLPDISEVLFRSMDFSPSGAHLAAATAIPSAFTVWRTDTLEPVLSWGDADFRRIIGTGETQTHVVARFLDDETLCMTVISLPPGPLDMITPALPAQEVVIGYLDIESGRFEEAYRDDRGGQLLPNAFCSPQRKWITLGYIDQNGVNKLDVIERESGRQAHAIDSPASFWRVYFGDDAGLMAVPGVRDWTFFDLNAGEYVSPPGSPPGFQLGYPQVFDALTDQPIGALHTAHLPVSNFEDRLWLRFPIGPELIALAIGQLDEDERVELQRERVGTDREVGGYDPQEQLTVVSENWARRSADLLKDGHRIPAIMAALRGLPERPTDEELQTFAPAHLALYTAYRTPDVRLPLTGRTTFLGAEISSDHRRALTGAQLATGKEIVELWDVENGRLLSVLLENARDRAGLTTPQRFMFSPDSRLVAIDDFAGSVRLFNASDAAQIAQMPFPPHQHQGDFQNIDLAFAPGSDHLAAVGSHPAELRVWSLPGNELKFSLTKAEIDRLGTGASIVTDVRVHFANDRHLCVVAHKTQDGRAGDVLLIVVDLDTVSIVNTYLLNDALDHYDGGVGSVHCSPDLKMATASYTVPTADGYPQYMHLLSLKGGVRKRMDLDASRLAAPLFDPLSRYIASPSFGSQFQGWTVFDTTSGAFVDHPTALPGYVHTFPRIVNSSDEVHLIEHVFSLYHEATLGKSRLWEDAPQGRELIEAALAVLDARQRDEVHAMRLR